MKKDQIIFEPFVYHWHYRLVETCVIHISKIWHYCLVETGVIHISKIRGYGLLESFDFINH